MQKLLPALVLIMSWSQAVVAQVRPPEQLEYIEALKQLRLQLPEVERAINQVKIEDLVIRYDDGKVIESVLETAKEALDLEKTTSEEVTKTRSLSDEVALLTTTLELQNAVESVGTTILIPNYPNKETGDKARAYARSLRDAEEHLDRFYRVAYKCTVLRADQYDKALLLRSTKPSQ